MAGFNLSHLNKPLKILPSNVINKYLWRSIILYITKGSTYFMATFLDSGQN